MVMTSACFPVLEAQQKTHIRNRSPRAAGGTSEKVLTESKCKNDTQHIQCFKRTQIKERLYISVLQTLQSHTSRMKSCKDLDSFFKNFNALELIIFESTNIHFL